MTKLTYDEKDLLSNKETMKVVVKVLEGLMGRHTEKLLSEPIEADGSGFQLVALRLRLDGMKGLIHDFRQQTLTNNKS
jgi:hypothetical protein